MLLQPISGPRLEHGTFPNAKQNTRQRVSKENKLNGKWKVVRKRFL
jgi:hypothetical protein